MKLLQNAPVANDPKRHFATIDYRIAKDLFDHLVGAAEQRSGNVMPSALAVFRLMIQFDFRCLLDRQVGGLVALENPAGIVAGQAV